ncbi:MAG: peptide deformylase [Bdellovibrionota bacterium]
MALLQIAKLGHPVLRKRAAEVPRPEIDSGEFQRLVDDMIETMRDADGAGLAAPQVFVSKRLVIVEVRKNPRYPDAPDIPLTVLVNPVLEPLPGDLEEGWEGCLSVDDLRGRVVRHTKLRVTSLDREGKSQNFEAEGFFARALQHECDHLDGVLFVDRVRDTRSLTHLREWRRYHLSEGMPEGGD